MASLSRIGFGGGCHWCTEAVFQALRGVTRVEQGFARSSAPEDAWSEAVIVDFDPRRISLEALTEIHLRTHASTSSHSFRHKYRSALYASGSEDEAAARAALQAAARGLDGEVVTQVLPLVGFRRSDPRFRNYYRTDPERPFCRTYIDPKLAMLRACYSAHV